MSEAGVMAEPEYRSRKKPKSVTPPVAAEPKPETAVAVTETEKAPPWPAELPGEAPLMAGHVRTRVLPRGHGRIATGANVAPPIVRDDDPRFEGLKGDAWVKAWERAFADACVDRGFCHAKGAFLQLPETEALLLEERGYVEILVTEILEK